MARSVKRTALDIPQNVSVENVEIKLPDSIILEIFSYLPFKDLCVVSRVCKRWNRIAKDDSIRKIIDVRENSISVKQVWKVLRYHCSSALRDFRLKGYVLLLKAGKPKWRTLTVTKALLRELKNQCPLLQTFCLEEVFLANEANSQLTTVRDLPENLMCLGLRNSFFHPDKFFGAKPSNSLPILEHLDLGHCPLVSSYDLHVFNDFHQLKELYLEGCCRINNGGINHIRSLVQHLKVLNVEGTDISEDGILTIINEGLLLKELYAGYCRFSNRIFTSSVKSTAVEILCLRFTSVSDNCIERFIYIFPHLNKIFLEGSQISQNGIRTLCSSLPNCKSDCNEEIANSSKCNHSHHHWMNHRKYH